MSGKRVCVYCASSSICDKKYSEAGRYLGEQLAKSGRTVVYGGASQGVMGALADGALSHGGQVIGYIPAFMRDESLHAGISEVHHVETMHLRKHGMMMNSDAIIALPGGLGTLEELTEALSWKRLQLITIPIIIINIDSFYDPLLKLFSNMISERFMTKHHAKNTEQLWTVVETVDEAIAQLK